MAVRIQIRRDPSNLWTMHNPVLAEGEFGYETDTGRLKLGDGSTPWNDLPYLDATPAGPNRAIQFNDNGHFGADEGFLFTEDKALRLLRLDPMYNLVFDVESYYTGVGGNQLLQFKAAHGSPDSPSQLYSGEGIVSIAALAPDSSGNFVDYGRLSFQAGSDRNFCRFTVYLRKSDGTAFPAFDIGNGAVGIGTTPSYDFHVGGKTFVLQGGTPVFALAESDFSGWSDYAKMLLGSTGDDTVLGRPHLYLKNKPTSDSVPIVSDFGTIFIDFGSNRLKFQNDDGDVFDLCVQAAGPAGMVQLSDGLGYLEYDSRLKFLGGTLYVGDSDYAPGTANVVSTSAIGRVALGRASADSEGALFRVWKARGAPSSPAAVVDGDIVGGIESLFHDGSQLVSGGAILWNVDNAEAGATKLRFIVVKGTEKAEITIDPDGTTHFPGTVYAGNFLIATGSFSVPAGTQQWIRFAKSSPTGAQNYGLFLVRWVVSGYHGHAIFAVSVHFNRPELSAFTLLNKSIYGTDCLLSVRLLTATTYDEMFLEIEVYNRHTSYSMNVEVFQLSKGFPGFYFMDLQDGSIPSGYNETVWGITNRVFASYVGDKPLFSGDTAGLAYLAKNVSADQNGLLESALFKPTTSYLSSDGSVGITKTIRVQQYGSSAGYELQIKNGIITDVTSI